MIACALALVGHEPDMSHALETLTGASLVRLQMGGVACIEFENAPEAGAGRLAWLIDPDLYQPAEANPSTT
jgi:phosphohistidine phosphatase SixA